MRRTLVLIGVLTASMVMFFQNCAPPMKGGVDSQNADGVIRLNPGGGNGSNNSEDSDLYRKTAANSYSTLTLVQNDKMIEIDLASGRADTYRGSDRIEEHCFADADLVAVREILSKAEVCEPVQPYAQNPGVMCTQIYSYPYAALGEGAQKINLGERFNGCHSPTDLCGEKSVALKTQVANLLGMLPSKSCQ